MKNKKLRLVWIIPNVFCYVLAIVFSSFVIMHAKELEEMNRLSIWILMLFLLFSVSVFESYRIRAWIKEGKM